jgi:hypothetical protein
MPLVGITEGDKGRQTVHYEAPRDRPRRVRRLRVLLLAAGTLSLLSILASVPGAVQVADEFEHVRATIANQPDVPPLASCVQDEFDIYCPTDDPNEAVQDPDDSCFRQDGETYCGAEWSGAVLAIILFKDAATIAANLAALVLTLLVGAAVYIPVRYFILWRQMGRAVPSALPAARRLAALQIALAFVQAVLIAAIFEGTEAFDGTAFTAGSAGLLLAPFILWIGRHPEVRQHFSAHELVAWQAAPPAAAPEPAAP